MVQCWCVKIGVADQALVRFNCFPPALERSARGFPFGLGTGVTATRPERLACALDLLGSNWRVGYDAITVHGRGR